MKSTLYTGIKTALLNLTFIKEDDSTGRIQTVKLWREQPKREAELMPDLLPAVYIEFLPSNFMEGSSQVFQTVDMTVRLHIIFESKKSEDVDILNLCDAIFSELQGVSYGTWGKLKRRNEEQDFDFDNLQDYIQDYQVTQGRDYGSDRRPSTPGTIDTLVINAEYDENLED